MKQTAKRILAFVMVVCMAFLGVIVTPLVSASAATSYVETKFGEGKLLITTTTKFDGKTYYLPAATTSSAPKAEVFTKVGDISEDNLWTVTADGSNYTIKNNAGKYLYATNTNNGIRVGDTSGTWTYGSDGSLKFNGTSDPRYLGVYNAQDWRCYKTSTASNYYASATSPSLKFYKVNAEAPSVSITGADYTQVGGTIALTATLAHLTGDVAWTSDNADVATVNAETGVVTAVAMGTAKITAAVGEVTAEKKITVYPVENSVLTIADAIKVCELTGTTNAPYVYSATGNVESIDTEYNSEYGNITVTITDGTNNIQAYRMTGGSDLAVNDNITVKGTLVNYNGNTPEFSEKCTYVKNAVDDGLAAIKEALNAVEANLSLAFKYTEENKTVDVSGEVVDKLTPALIGGGNSYNNWSKTAQSGATYAGNSYLKNTTAIQLKAKEKTSGIVTTTSVGKATKVSVVWNDTSDKEQTVNIYGSNTAYTAVTDLYDNTKNGDLIGTIQLGTSTELSFTGYEYIGIASADGSVYLTSVSITWDTGATGTTTETSYKEVDFRVRCGVDNGVAAIEGIDGYGIRVTINGNHKDYDATAKSWDSETDPEKYFVLIALGNLFENPDRFNATITVQAYVVVGEFTYVSEKVKQLSVADMVAAYYNGDSATVKEKVEHLYNYLFNVEEE